MPTTGNYHGSTIGGSDQAFSSQDAGATTQTLATPVNKGLSYRFTAADTRDIISVNILWNAVSAPGTITLRIETNDTSTGKPTGTLYDSPTNNAQITFTPTAGWQTVTFASAPTAGLVAGNQYHIVIFCATTGTTMTISHLLGQTSDFLPTAVLTASDVSTRSNLAEITGGGIPMCTLVLEDSSEEAWGMLPWGPPDSGGGALNLFGTQAAGMKFIIAAGFSVVAVGFWACFKRFLTPAGDVVVKLLNSSDQVIANSTYTAPVNSITGINSRRIGGMFAANITLTPGTYRLMFTSPSSANTSNSFGICDVPCKSAGMAPANVCLTTTSDITANPIVWTDTATKTPMVHLVLNDIVPTGSGGGVPSLICPIGSMQSHPDW